MKLKKKAKIELKDASFDLSGEITFLENQEVEIKMCSQSIDYIKLYNWVMETYKESPSVENYKAKVTIEDQVLIGAWPRAIDFEDLDMLHATNPTIILKLHYDRQAII